MGPTRCTLAALGFKGSETGSKLGPVANNGENIASGRQCGNAATECVLGSLFYSVLFAALFCSSFTNYCFFFRLDWRPPTWEKAVHLTDCTAWVIFIPPPMCLWGGGRCIMFTRCPSVHPSVRPSATFLAFQYLEKAMPEFNKIWQTH